MRNLTKVLLSTLGIVALLNVFVIVSDIHREIKSTNIKLHDDMDSRIDSIHQDINLIQNEIKEFKRETKQNSSLLAQGELDLKNKIQKLPDLIKYKKFITEQFLRQITVMVVNKTANGLGSGVSIKYKGKFYILTAAHMLVKDTDAMYLFENKTEICELKIIKWDNTFNEIQKPGEIVDSTSGVDLLLLAPKNERIVPRFYVELADTEPISGSELYIVGNPLGMERVISEGRIIFYRNNFLYYIDHTYFGNSGGGIYTKDGYLVGIVSHMEAFKPVEQVPAYVINGAVRLEVIKHFLEGVQ